MNEVETQNVIARWFDAMVMRHRLNTERTVEAAETERRQDTDIQDSVNDVLHMLIEMRAPDAHEVFAESLMPPSKAARTEPSDLATQQQLAEALNHLSADTDAFGVAMAALVPFAADHALLQAEPLSGAVTPYGQVNETGSPDLSIYNASYIPVRYWPSYVQTAADAPQQPPKEAEVMTYLTERGLDQDLVSKAAAAFKTASARLRFLLWLGALVSVATYVLATLRREVADPALSADDMQLTGALTKGRRTIQI